MIDTMIDRYDEEVKPRPTTFTNVAVIRALKSRKMPLIASFRLPI
jgi:hypothetical protein